MNIKTTITLKPSDGFKSLYPIENLSDGITVPSDGFALFGPYVDLPSGVWEVSVIGELICSSENCWFDVTGENGVIVLLKSQITDSKGLVCWCKINVRFPLKNVELRIYLSSQTFIKITSIEFIREDNQGKADFSMLSDSGRQMQIYERYSLRLILDKSSLVDKYLIDYNVWEDAQITYLKQLIYRCSTDGIDKRLFLDIGAYFGLYSMIISKMNYFDEIIAFEVDPFNYRQLLGNLLLNDPNFHIQSKFLAVSDRDGEGLFVQSTEHPEMNRGGMGLLLPSQTSLNAITIQTRTLDGLIKHKNNIVFGKIDVEGHEIQVINGMLEFMTSNLCLFQIECLSTGDRFEEMNNIMLNRGYTLINRIQDDYYYSNFL